MNFESEGEISFDSLFIGYYSPTNAILESLLTRDELVKHCELNIFTLKSQHNKIEECKK
jgi:hypothetical protein